ncbi:MAG TPA: hypothetical protein VD816_16050 [Ohtaekwangia sp.]|nr:hypothetical protein [Ohtaekwangia sp.]
MILRPAFTGTLIAVALFFCLHNAHAQSLNSNWKQQLNTALQQFLECKPATPDDKACAKFIGESLNTVYQLNDFYSTQAKRYMTVNEIAGFLETSNKWEVLGQSYDQKTLATAQDYANKKRAVVAVYLNAAGIGHVVLITPGELKPSGSWALNVPSAASFFPTEPDKSFVDKSLSFAFMKHMMKDVQIYARKY